MIFFKRCDGPNDDDRPEILDSEYFLCIVQHNIALELQTNFEFYRRRSNV